MKIGKKFQDTLGKLGNTVGATSAKVGLAFAGMFDGVGEALAAALGRAQEPIVAFAKAAAEVIKPIFADIANAIAGDTDKISSQFILVLIPTVTLFGQAFVTAGQIIGGVFTVLNAGFQAMADGINAVFGTKLVAGDIPAFTAAIYLGVKAIGALAAAFTVLTLAASPWLLILGGIALAVAAFLVPLDTLKTALTAIFGEEIAAKITGFLETARDQWNTAWTAMSDWVGTKIREMIAFFEPLLAVIRTVGAALARMQSTVGDTGVPTSITTTKDNVSLAGGGYIRGPGSGTSDSIRALVSNGEYINTARAVRYWGPEFFEALNRLRMPNFSLGGLVEGLSRPLMTTPRFAEGGLVAAPAGGGMGATVHLHFPDGQSFGPLMTDAQTAAAVGRYARGKALMSAGRKPGWNS